MFAGWLSSGPPKSIVKISVVTSLTCGVYLLRDYYKGEKFENDVSCEGKVAIVTGGNSGIGKETARELARRGATVFLLCRDKERCVKARKEIVLSTKNKYVYARECDLGCLDSVRQFAKKFLKEESQLDILVNNAGVWCVPYGKTKDGFETHLGVNHMGHFLLTNLLLDLLVESAPSRIVNVTASTHVRGNINKEDLNSDNKYSPMDAYNQSKLANILFTMELSERLKDKGVTVNAVNPGTSYTDLYRKQGSGLGKSLGNILMKPLMWMFLKTPQGGAQVTLYAALDPALETVTGKYFESCKGEGVTPEVSDSFTAKWLWAVSEKWTRLKYYKEILFSDEEPQHDHKDEGNVVFA